METISAKVYTVLDWLPDDSAEIASELFNWAEDIDDEGNPARLVTVDDFPYWWDMFKRLAGGDMPTSMQTDIKVLFGEVALQADIDNSSAGEDDAGIGATACRQALVAAGLAPGGMWRVSLLVDCLDNAFTGARQWAGLDPSEAADALRRSLKSILDESEEMGRTTLNAQAKRVTTAIAAVCSLHLECADETRRRVERFFELERQYKTEAGEVDTEVELTYIAFAGVTAYANLGDLDGIERVMRRVRQRTADGSGELPPRFMTIWANGLKSLDPALAQMIARQLLMDATNVNLSEDRSDAEFAASFLLLETSLFTGDIELADELANTWVPLAIEAPYGPGSQQWVNVVDESTDEDESDGLDGDS